MAKTQTKTQQQTAPQEAPQANLPAPATQRLPYSKALGQEFGLGIREWQVLVDAIWPSAQSLAAVSMALAYCKARNLDPFKRPIHIVPVWSKQLNRMVETVWPGISELRTTATRTGSYAGCDEAVFGPDLTRDFGNGKAITFPEWCQLTVYKIVQGQRVAFAGPKVYWLESYATVRNDSDVPNGMWTDRPRGQLEKCAEAAALRRAYPEELGGVYAAEEMTGRTIHGAIVDVTGQEIEPRPDPDNFGNGQPQAQATTGEKNTPRAEAPAKENARQEPAQAAKTKAQDGPPAGDPRFQDQQGANPGQKQGGSDPDNSEAGENEASESGADGGEAIENEEKDPAVTDAMAEAEKLMGGWLFEIEGAMVPAELAGIATQVRDNIKALPGLDAEDRAVLNGRVNQAVLERQRALSKKAPRK